MMRALILVFTLYFSVGSTPAQAPEWAKSAVTLSMPMTLPTIPPVVDSMIKTSTAVPGRKASTTGAAVTTGVFCPVTAIEKRAASGESLSTLPLLPFPVTKHNMTCPSCTFSSVKAAPSSFLLTKPLTSDSASPRSMMIP